MVMVHGLQTMVSKDLQIFVLVRDICRSLVVNVEIVVHVVKLAVPRLANVELGHPVVGEVGGGVAGGAEAGLQVRVAHTS